MHVPKRHAAYGTIGCQFNILQYAHLPFSSVHVIMIFLKVYKFFAFAVILVSNSD